MLKINAALLPRLLHRTHGETDVGIPLIIIIIIIIDIIIIIIVVISGRGGEERHQTKA